MPLDVNEGQTQKVETIRETHISNAGFHIEEYENSNLLDPDDDINLGVLPVKWSAEAFDETAKEEKDLDYAGVLDENTGKFTPNISGPNTQRKLMTNNAGNLSVIATYKDTNVELSEKAHLMVTVPKFVNPPIN